MKIAIARPKRQANSDWARSACSRQGRPTSARPAATASRYMKMPRELIQRMSAVSTTTRHSAAAAIATTQADVAPIQAVAGRAPSPPCPDASGNCPRGRSGMAAAAPPALIEKRRPAQGKPALEAKGEQPSARVLDRLLRGVERRDARRMGEPINAVSREGRTARSGRTRDLDEIRQQRVGRLVDAARRPPRCRSRPSGRSRGRARRRRRADQQVAHRDRLGRDAHAHAAGLRASRARTISRIRSPRARARGHVRRRVIAAIPVAPHVARAAGPRPSARWRWRSP